MMITRERLLVLAVLLAGAAEVGVRDATPMRVTAAVTGVVMAVAVALRRSRPLAAVALGFGWVAALDLVALAAGLGPVRVWTATVVLLLVVALTRYGHRGELVGGAAIVLAVWGLSVTVEPTGLTDAVGGLVVLALAAALGALSRYRLAAVAAQTARVRTRERELLARELHDTVAHHVSGIAVQAQAGQALAAGGNCAGAVAALARIEAEASLTLTEMRGLVGTLRSQDGIVEDAVPRGLGDLPGLAVAAVAGHPRVEVEVVDTRDVPPAVGSAVYRVAQEAVTNAVRHARDATTVRVTVSGDAESVTVRVVDDGRRGHVGPRRPGYGLIGMAERAALLGGTLEAGPTGDQGWTVLATLPRRAGRA